MRTLPKKKSEKQNLVIKATHDYFGVGNKVRANQIALWLMGRKRGVKLTDEELSESLLIKENLNDKIYLQSLV